MNKRVNKLNEAHAIVKASKRDLERLDKLRLSIVDRNEFANELVAVNEALEFLRVKLQSMAIKATGGAE